jgi:cytidylate kinase/small subunit ribosomal protein S1
MILAIDGPAGCGKSSIAKMLSDRLGFTYVNSGNIYRAISLYALRSGISADAPDALIKCAQAAPIRYSDSGEIMLGDEMPGAELRMEAVDAIVAQVSAVPEVRHVVNAIVAKIASADSRQDIVVEGRDMTTVVFPNADLKFYLDAHAEVRARRRFNQRASSMSLDQIRENILMRDQIDKNKPEGALKIASDAIYLDTSSLTIEQVYEKVYRKILTLREAHG